MLREKIKNWKMELAAVLVFVLVLGMTGLSGSVKAADQTDLKTIDIMFVHDTHSHLNSFSTVVDEKQEMIGGFARIKTLIDEQKEKDPDTLVVDGGDFSMGTLVQTVFETQAAEIRMLGALGCEATTLETMNLIIVQRGLLRCLKPRRKAEIPCRSFLSVISTGMPWNSRDSQKDSSRSVMHLRNTV